MKRIVSIPKSRLTSPIDLGEVISTRCALGIKLEYNELGFMQIEGGRVVLFDAYSASHTYSPINAECGVVAFPFWLGCMTDGGERVAYCGLRFSEERAAEWKLCFDGAVAAQLANDPDAAAVDVTSGVCCLADVAAYETYKKHIKDEVHPLSGNIILNGQTHAAIDLFGKKYAVFSTGWGDGRFKVYAGRTADGRLTALMVDFGMIEYPRPADDGQTVELEVETKGSAGFVYDPTKSEEENNIARWTAEIESATDPKTLLMAYSRRGYTYHSLNDPDKALADYNAAVEECKHVKDRVALLHAWSVYDNAAEIYCQRNDYESAITLMEAALAVRDNAYSGAYVRLIDLYLVTKRTDKAADIAERMLRARPNDPVACMKYAEVCVAAMNYTGAARTYERLASEFQLYENLFDEASCLIELGDLDGANNALERHPSKEYNEQYWYYKAYIDFKKQRYTDALKKAEKSYSIDREYMPALYLLIDIHSIMQEYLAVARYAEEYKKLRPDKEYGYSVCAEAQLILGNFSECSRNYGYLYDYIKKDDKYAALSAITAARMGDKSRKSKMLKMLRRKRSPYYGAAIYAVYISRYKERDMALSRVVYKLSADDDFLLQLAVYLTGTENVLPATHILDMLYKKNNSSSEVVAQQVRTAARLGDEKLFGRLLGYYLEKYAGVISDDDKVQIAERFKRGGAMRKVDWASIKPETPEALGLRKKPAASRPRKTGGKALAKNKSADNNAPSTKSDKSQ